MGFDNPIHIAFLLIILLLVFGAKRLPEIGRSLGDGMRGFKESIGGELAHSPVRVDMAHSGTSAEMANDPAKVAVTHDSAKADKNEAR